MASLGFAACLQELLSDRRARYLLNFLTTFTCETYPLSRAVWIFRISPEYLARFTALPLNRWR